MKPFDAFLAMLVVVVRGPGFVGCRLALDELSPALIAVSAAPFLGQFLSQSRAIAHGVPVGLASALPEIA